MVSGLFLKKQNQNDPSSLCISPDIFNQQKCNTLSYVNIHVETFTHKVNSLIYVDLSHITANISEMRNKKHKLFIAGEALRSI